MTRMRQPAPQAAAQPSFGQRSSFARSRRAQGARQLVCGAWSNNKAPDETLAEVAMQRQSDEILESLQLRKEVRDRVTDAVEDLGGQVSLPPTIQTMRMKAVLQLGNTHLCAS